MSSSGTSTPRKTEKIHDSQAISSSSKLHEIPSRLPSATGIYTSVNTTEEILEDALVLPSHCLYLLILQALITP